jgi:enoyl-CoA hydratase/carnithine racemase
MLTIASSFLTGAGRAFIDNIDPEGFDFFTPRGFDKVYREGKKMLSNILDISAPLIAALNGPTTVHSEYALLADVVLATPDTVFQDKPHLNFGIVPGDGIHSLWQEVIDLTVLSSGVPRSSTKCSREGLR